MTQSLQVYLLFLPLFYGLSLALRRRSSVIRFSIVAAQRLELMDVEGVALCSDL